MQLVTPDIDRVDLPRPPRAQHFAEAAGRGADIDAHATRRVEAEMIERGDKLQRPARNPWMLGLRLQPRIGHDLLRSEEHTSELQSQSNLVCRLLLEKK